MYRIKIIDQIKFQQMHVIDVGNDRKCRKDRTEGNFVTRSRHKYAERTDCYRVVDSGRLGRSVVIFRQAIRRNRLHNPPLFYLFLIRLPRFYTQSFYLELVTFSNF